MQVLNIFHVLIAIALVAFVLIQKGQGATAGAAFGSGASGTVFGARGAGNFLTRSTWVLATLFCTISLTMAVLVSRISALPESDLGVVGSPQAAPVVEQSQPVNEVSVTSDEPLVTDIPSFDAADDDVPAPETNAVTEEIPAAEGEDDSSGSGGSDS
ncbi:preprotein translocase subunit SecG [Pseudomonadota bacterium]|jgi:preprotein translocase subunit SecG